MTPPVVAGWSGVLYVVLSLVVGAFVQGKLLPTVASPGSRVVDFYARHRAGFLVGNYLGVLALVPSVPFTALLLQLLRERGAELAGLTFFGLGLLAHALGAACLAAFQTIPLVTEPGLAKVVSDLANQAFGLCFVLMAGYLAAAGWGVLATGALPGWVGWTALALVVPSLVASLGTIVTTGPLAAGGRVTLAAFVGYLAWSLAVSVHLLRSPPV